MTKSASSEIHFEFQKYFKWFLEKKTPNICFSQEALQIFFQDPLKFLLRNSFKNILTNDTFSQFKNALKQILKPAKNKVCS